MNANRRSKSGLWARISGLGKPWKFVLGALAVVAVLGLAELASLAWLVTANLRPPRRVPAPDYWPTDGWRTSTPEEQGFSSAKIAAGLKAIRENGVGAHSLLIIRNGYLVLDAHFAPYDGTQPHDLASVTKSVMTTLIGIAESQGKIDLDRPVVSYFPGRTILNLDERKARLTVRHLARMANGMESGCYEGDEPTLEKMRATPDWVQAALDRPMVADPGSAFCYDSPGMHLLSAVLTEATGLSAFDFAQKYLFAPLGIRTATWDSDPQGYTRGWGDLHLLPEDAAKLGLLWLQRGRWDGQQIVPESWVVASVKMQSKSGEPDPGYGYGWWITPGDYQASGRNGQRIRITATRNTVLVATGSDFDYSTVESWLLPQMLFLSRSRRADPAGLAELQSVLRSLEPDKGEWAAALPSTAAQVSGRTYTCESNPLALETFRMTFDEAAQATLTARLDGKDWVWPVGLDGSYRLSADGTGYRGVWQDAQTFQLEVFDIEVLERQVQFNDDRLRFTLPEYEITVECKVRGI